MVPGAAPDQTRTIMHRGWASLGDHHGLWQCFWDQGASTVESRLKEGTKTKPDKVPTSPEQSAKQSQSGTQSTTGGNSVSGTTQTFNGGGDPALVRK